MFGDRPIAEDIANLERNDRGLTLSDKHVSIAFIRPLWTFNVHCLIDHKTANHRLDRKLISSKDAGDLCHEWNFDKWKMSVGKSLHRCNANGGVVDDTV